MLVRWTLGPRCGGRSVGHSKLERFENQGGCIVSLHSHYPSLTKSERKDALVPDPQEYDMSDPERSKITPLSAKARLKVFKRLVCSIQGV